MILRAEQSYAQLGFLLRINQGDDYVAFAEPGVAARNNRRVAAQYRYQIAFRRQINITHKITCCRRSSVHRIFEYLESPILKTEQSFDANSRKLAFNDLLNNSRRADSRVNAEPRHHLFIFRIGSSRYGLWHAENFFGDLAGNKIILVAAGRSDKDASV